MSDPPLFDIDFNNKMAFIWLPLDTCSLTEHSQMGLPQSWQPAGQSLPQGHSKIEVFRVKNSVSEIKYTLHSRFTQATSALRQIEMHSESVGSHLVMHVRVFSTHNSLQISLSSKSLKNIT